MRAAAAVAQATQLLRGQAVLVVAVQAARSTLQVQRVLPTQAGLAAAGVATRLLQARVVQA